MMNEENMWNCFVSQTGIQAKYETWAFGDDPDRLAYLTLNGIKTATASAYPLYEAENEPLPKAGELSMVLDGNGNPVCIIQCTKVSVVPFCQVTQEHAWKEGEGDRSLKYWSEVHEAFFSKELMAAGLQFDEKMLVVCEEFVRLYPGDCNP